MNPYSVVGSFGLALIALSIWKPQAARMTIGIFYLVMALGVNLPLLALNPELYPLAGSHALLPLYAWFFTVVMPLALIPLIKTLILVEAAIGLAVLYRGKAVKVGLIAVALFCLLITPVGMEEITAPLIGIAALLSLRAPMESTLLDSFKKHQTFRGQI
jgi:hypothetical protein